MRIDTNSIGNYSAYLRPVQARPKVEAAVTVEPAKVANVTNEEKNFFVKMYPENKSEIMDYHFYGRDGKMSGVSVGSLFDRRG